MSVADIPDRGRRQALILKQYVIILDKDYVKERFEIPNINDILEIDGKLAPQDKMECLTRCSKKIFDMLKISSKQWAKNLVAMLHVAVANLVILHKQLPLLRCLE